MYGASQRRAEPVGGEEVDVGPEGRGRRKLCRRRGRASRAWYPCWPLRHGRPAAGRGKAGGAQGAAGTEQEAGCPDGGGRLGRAGREAVRVSPGGLSTLPSAQHPALRGSPGRSLGLGQRLRRVWEGLYILAAAGSCLASFGTCRYPMSPVCAECLSSFWERGSLATTADSVSVTSPRR